MSFYIVLAVGLSLIPFSCSQTTTGQPGCSFNAGGNVFNVLMSRDVPPQSCPDVEELRIQHDEANGKINELTSQVLQLQSSLGRMAELNTQIVTKLGELEIQMRTTKEAVIRSEIATSVCPPEYDLKSVQLNSCYLFVENHLNWYDAETFCLSTGGHLVSLETSEEQLFIMKELKNNTVWSENHFWTGGNDIAEENHWVWAGSNVPFNYTNWLLYPHPDEGDIQNPDNYNGVEHCLQLFHVYNFTWNDAYCGQRYKSVCEFKIL